MPVEKSATRSIKVERKEGIPLISSPPLRGLDRFNEEIIIRQFFKSLNLPSDHCILDVGCGFGRKMEWLVEDGFKVEGVDVNQETINAAREKGFSCMTVEQFNRTEQEYDAMLMAHIIEHFAPEELLIFMDTYLDRLRVGGYLVIATPLEHSNFYADFDHVKTYHPTAIRSVFESESSQVQYHSRNKLRLVDIGLRRRPIGQPRFEELHWSLHRMDFLRRVTHGGFDIVNKILFKITGGVLRGITNGWIGVFEKL